MVKFAQMPKYEAYKDSGVEWLGEIPAEWNVVRFRDLFKFGRGLTITKAELEEEGVPCINYGEVHSKYGFEFTPTKNHLKCVSEDYLLTNPNSLLEKGDFIFADTSEDIEGSGNFSQLITDDVVFAGYHSVICRPIGSNNYRYLAYCLESTLYRNQVRQQVKGVKVYSITQTILKNTMVWLPSHGEQSLIANFLDQKTAQIDAAIAIKEQQIELLKERKQIIIQQAVTQGLDPSVPMKDSGVEWIGQIPEHWEVIRFCDYFQFDRGLNITKADLQEEGVPCINYGEIHSKYGFEVTPQKHELKCVSKRYLSRNANSIVNKGDIIFADTSEDIEGSGNFSQLITNDTAFAGYHTVICRPVKEDNSRYLAYLLDSIAFRNQIRQQVKGVKVYSITQTILKNTKILLPSVKEQALIAGLLDKSVEEIDIEITINKQQSATFKEYKTTLINSAVTGKIKITSEMLQA